MDKRLRKYYYAATINLLLWLPLVSIFVFPRLTLDPIQNDVVRGIVVAGALLAAMLQHWTYYDIYNAKTRLSTSLPNDRNA